ncbi:phosphotransferase system IIC component, glucose/maltose/N-acetylglucosamine-specific [Solibacillus silvestris StLB046]|uniref:Phosphotransferase system IIC component, glucose/maltose/N-acetylglucosamine-specific n=1 Tax=Solibacillus silvestris (strain StLB046) TaxID=1002809 RepID=F2F2N1_SOLSS|nr:SPP1 phage holin family protein [Solibacillus silvestris]BAK15869.1 phosphotransferase system IIC component, glucose/maltose/N-acetylglucosamine-specific [Solibacillus silvestris StLB046]
MTADKLKQYIALFGGLLGAVLLFLQTLGVHSTWFTQETIDSFLGVLMAAVPLALVVYGVYKNTYIVTKKAKEQEELLKRRGMK